jgi:hypothetical protein
MKNRNELEVVMEEGRWRLVNDPSYPTPLSIYHRCPPLTETAAKTISSLARARVTCLGNWVSFRQGVCCGCEMTIPTDMLTIGRFAHWEQIYGWSR